MSLIPIHPTGKRVIMKTNEIETIVCEVIINKNKVKVWQIKKSPVKEEVGKITQWGCPYPKNLPVGSLYTTKLSIPITKLILKKKS